MEEAEYAEIDGVEILNDDTPLRANMQKLYAGTNDPFMAIPRSLLSASQKRKVKRLEKLADDSGQEDEDLEKASVYGFPTGGKSINTGMVNQTSVTTKYTTTKGGARPKYLTPEQIYNGYFLWHLATPPFDLSYLTELSLANSTHYACIKAKVTNIVGLGHKWQPTSKTKQATRKAADDDLSGEKSQKFGNKLANIMEQLDEWLEGMNLQEAFIDTLTKIWIDVEATGNGYMEVGRNANGSIGYVGHIPADSMRVRVDRDGYVQMLPSQINKLIFFRNFGDKTTKDLFMNDPKPNEVIQFKKEHPKNAYYGIPDIIAALMAVAGDKMAADYNLEYFENKAVPRYALIVKGAKLSAQSERRILEYFRKEVKGKNHGTLYIPLPAGAGTNVDVKLEAIENEVQEFSFKGYREANKTEIMTVHRVPASQIAASLGGAGQGGGLSANREDSKVFKDQVCRPEQSRVEWKLSLIIKSFTDMFKFEFNQLSIDDDETMSRIYDRFIRMGVYCPNDVLAKLGEQPRKGGDQFLDPTQKGEGDANLNVTGAAAMGVPGPPRITTEGSPKNTNNGSVRTPASQQGPASRFAPNGRQGEAQHSY